MTKKQKQNANIVSMHDDSPIMGGDTECKETMLEKKNSEETLAAVSQVWTDHSLLAECAAQ